MKVIPLIKVGIPLKQQPEQLKTQSLAFQKTQGRKQATFDIKFSSNRVQITYDKMLAFVTFIIADQIQLDIIMKRQTINTNSTNKPIESSAQKQSRRRSRHTSNNSSLIFSQIPRAALIESSNQLPFQKEFPSRTNLFQPATSQCDYIQFQQPFHIYSQKTNRDSLEDADSSKKQHFWRVLESNNQVVSRRSSNSQSSGDGQKTSKKWSYQKDNSQSLKYKTIQEQELMENRTQTSAQNSVIQPQVKKSNSFSISNKEIDLKVTPKQDQKRDPIKGTQSEIKERIAKDKTIQRKVTFAQMYKNRSRIKPLHTIKRKATAADTVWLEKLHYVEWDEADLTVEQKYKRYNLFPMRKTRVPPLKYWVGQRIVYKKNGEDGVWLQQQRQSAF